MPGPSLRSRARLPLMSTIDVVRAAIFQRGSLPMVVRSNVSGDWATIGVVAQVKTKRRDVPRFFIASYLRFNSTPKSPAYRAIITSIGYLRATMNGEDRRL